jgi:hypothetical protein
VHSILVVVYRSSFSIVFLFELWRTGARTLVRTAGQRRAALVLGPRSPRPFSYSKQAASASSCSPLPCSSFISSFFSRCRLDLAEQQRPCVLRFHTSPTVALPTPALSCRTCSLEQRSPLAPSSCKFSDFNRTKFWCPVSFLSLCCCVLYDPILSLFSYCVFCLFSVRWSELQQPVHC